MFGTEVLKTYKVTSGTKVTLPCNKATSRYAFMGWSTVSGQHKNPQYYPLQTITVSQNMTLYAVRLRKSKDIVPSSITAVNTRKYQQVIMVGDSRMYHTQMIAASLYGSNYLASRHISIVGRNGQRLNGFSNTANTLGTYGRLMSEIKSLDPNKKTAIVFNLGVNDLRSTYNFTTTKRRYAAYLNNLEKELNNYNCDLILMSVNPVNSTTAATALHSDERVRQFNAYLKENVNYDGYIDTYTWLYRTGFSFYHYRRLIDDGLHFSPASSMRILRYVIQRVNAGAF